METQTGDGATRLDLAKEAASILPASLVGEDRIALWEFSSEIAPDRVPWRVLLPFTPAQEAAAPFAASVERLEPIGQTQLYATTRAAVDYVRNDYDAGGINAVILLSDGKQDPAEPAELEPLLAELSAGSIEKPVRVFTIAYGGDADTQTLVKISEATRAQSFTAADVTALRDITVDVLSNF
jgi:Ca-activated chloride channel homolog